MRILKGLAIRLANKLAPKPAPVVRTTDSILEDITEKVALLHVHASKREDEALVLQLEASALVQRSKEAQEDSERAQRVADKLEELLA